MAEPELPFHWITEEEAQKKRCSNPTYHWERCRASECMAWRRPKPMFQFVPATKAADKPPGDGWEFVYDDGIMKAGFRRKVETGDRGFCGLVGE